MKIIIIGNGKVGYTLAKQLSGESHELVLVDQNVEALQEAELTLDVMCIEGNGACGKGHKEWVKVSDGGPYLKCKVRLG